MRTKRNQSIGSVGSFIAIICVIAIGILGFDVVEPSYGFFGKVPAGHVGIVTTFGKISDGVLDEGLHTKPVFAKITRMDVRTQVINGVYEAFSSDIQQVQVGLTVSFNVNKEGAMNLFKLVGTNYVESILLPRVKENTKVIISHYTAESLIENRELLSGEVLKLMQHDMAPYGIAVTSVSIEDVDFTDAFTSAVEAKQVATQEKLAAQTEEEKLTMQKEAEAAREIIAAEAQAERDKISANANAEVIRINADTAAYAVLVEAEAQAEANALLAESLSEELINYDVMTRWDGKLPMYYGGEMFPVLDMTEDWTLEWESEWD